MQFVRSLTVMILLVASITANSTANPEPSTFVITHAPRVYEMEMKEFHECVSCNENDQARKAYDQCFQDLSPKNHLLFGTCCKASFDKQFCDKAASGTLDYATMCQKPTTFVEVDRCFWKNLQDKKADDIQKYRQCKRQIIHRFCGVSHTL